VKASLARVRAAVTLAPVLVVVAFAAACSRHDASPSSSPAVDLPLPPPPAALLAEGELARPDVAWTEVQKQLGTLGAFLPATFAGVVGSVLDVDRELTALVDGASPLYFAVAASGPSSVEWALALPVKDAARVAALLGTATAASDGGAVTLYSQPDAGEGTRADSRVLARVPAAPRFLLIASDRGAARDLAPYVARVLPTAPQLPRGPDDARALLVNVPHAALAGPVPALAAARWAESRADLAQQAASARERHGGRAADFADPDAILALGDDAVKRALARVADLDHALVRVEVGDDLVSAQVAMTPVAGGTVAAPWVQGLSRCDLAPLAAEPLDVAAAALVCSRAADRVTFAETLGAAVRTALGARLSAADGDRLQKALKDLAQARGDWLAGALALGGVVRLDMPAADGAAARQAIHTLVDLAHAPGLAEPLAADLGVRVRPPQNDSAVLQRSAAGAPAAAAASGAAIMGTIAWRSEGEHPDHLVVAAGAGHDATALLAPPARTLADDAKLAALLAALARPTFALVVQPQMATSAVADARPHAALAFAYGATGGSSPDAYLRLVADPGLARAFARLAAGF
jgi:hypothetical protein